MARHRRPVRDPDEVPDELRPDGWKHFTDRADLDDADAAVFRARAQRRQSVALSAWADEQGISWAEACRRVGHGATTWAL